jgi:hypothetical protein
VRAKEGPQTISRRDAVDALKRSGYLLESRADVVLRSLTFHVDANVLFLDDATGKQRELDLWAGWAMGYEFGPNNIGGVAEGGITLELVIECIHPPQPLAFVMRERPEPFFERTDAFDALKLVGNPPERDTSPHHTWSWLASKLDLKKYHHYRVPRVATQYCTFSKKQGTADWMALHRDEDHQTFRKLCCATDHFVRAQVVPSYNLNAGWSLSLVYPVLLVEGELYEVSATQRSARLRRSDHVQYRLSQSVGGEENDYCVDVITERFLPAYTRMLIREMRLMSKRLNTRHDELRAFRRSREANYAHYLENREAGASTAPAI